MLKNLKKQLNNIKLKLKEEFTKSINKCWKNKVKSIPRNDSSSMFPQLNSIFRKKDSAEIATLKIPTNSQILNVTGIDTDKAEKDNNDNILINILQDKLDIMGAHFAGINNKKNDNNRPQFNNIIEKEIKSFKDQIKNEEKTTNHCAPSTTKIQRIIPTI